MVIGPREAPCKRLYLPDHRRISPPVSEHHRLRTPLTNGEVVFLRTLMQSLDPRWEIYVQPHLNGLRPDFVLLHPENGVAVFEVKDWDLDGGAYWVAPGGQLMCRSANGTAAGVKIRNPFRRLLDYKYEILDLYCPRLGGQASLGAISAGLVLPNAKGDRGRIITELRVQAGVGEYSEQFPVVTAEELEKGTAEALFPLHRRRQSLMNEQVARDLRHWLVEPDFAAEQRRPLDLDTDQRRLAGTRTDSGFRRIRGPAGSGKSLVLAARAAELCDQGHEVLVVTFNITLLNYLRDLFLRAIRRQGSIGRVTWLHFHYLCKRLARDLDLEEEYSNLWRGNHEWVLESGLAAFALNALKRDGAPGFQRFNAVLVDEGQNFDLSWWNVVRELGASGRDGAPPERVLAVDSTQDLYGKARSWTEQAMKGAGFSGPWATLSVSYRIPPAFVDHLERFGRLFLPADDFVQLPMKPQMTLDLYPFSATWKQVEVGGAGQACLAAIDSALMASGEEKPLVFSELVLLSSSSAVGQEVCDLLEARGINVLSTFADPATGTRGQQDTWRSARLRKMYFSKGDGRVKVTTIHSFQGWEARFVVVQVDDTTNPTSLYTALTRLKRHRSGSSITVVSSSKAFAEYGRTWGPRAKEPGGTPRS